VSMCHEYLSEGRLISVMSERSEPTDRPTDRPTETLPDAPLDSPVKKLSGKNPLDCKTFLVTISPKGDVEKKCEESLLKWVEKNSDYGYVVAERGKNGQRHLHMCLAFEVARSKQRMQEDLWKFKVRKFHPESIGKIAVVVTVSYDHRWYDEYLRKETGVEVLYDYYDRDKITELFPPREVQQLLTELKGKRVCDTYMHEHCLLWQETDLPVSVAGALRFLRERMFKEKTMNVIQDDRRVRQLALALYRYRSEDCGQSMEDDEWLNRCDPVRGSLYVHGQQNAAPP